MCISCWLTRMATNAFPFCLLGLRGRACTGHAECVFCHPPWLYEFCGMSHTRALLFVSVCKTCYFVTSLGCISFAKYFSHACYCMFCKICDFVTNLDCISFASVPQAHVIVVYFVKCVMLPLFSSVSVLWGMSHARVIVLVFFENVLFRH